MCAFLPHINEISVRRKVFNSIKYVNENLSFSFSHVHKNAHYNGRHTICGT